MSQPGRSGNYIESSGTAMFIYAILKGIRMGYLDGATYLATATLAYEKMVAKFVTTASDGGLNVSVSVRCEWLSPANFR